MICPCGVRLLRDFHEGRLDELGAWDSWCVVGHSPLRNDDGRIMLFVATAWIDCWIPATVDEAGGDFDDRHHLLLATWKRGAPRSTRSY
jgi:hypothetical protein